jgi:hypothetical protein
LRIDDLWIQICYAYWTAGLYAKIIAIAYCRSQVIPVYMQCVLQAHLSYISKYLYINANKTKNRWNFASTHLRGRSGSVYGWHFCTGIPFPSPTLKLDQNWIKTYLFLEDIYYAASPSFTPSVILEQTLNNAFHIIWTYIQLFKSII